MWYYKYTLFLVLLIFVIGSVSVNTQSCKFSMRMGEKYDKCSAICQGRNYRCISDDTCLCQECPNNMDSSYVHTFDEISCEFTQECTRKCMDAITDPDSAGNLGRGKKCSFNDDYYGLPNSVCTCACL